MLRIKSSLQNQKISSEQESFLKANYLSLKKLLRDYEDTLENFQLKLLKGSSQNPEEVISKLVSKQNSKSPSKVIESHNHEENHAPEESHKPKAEDIDLLDLDLNTGHSDPVPTTDLMNFEQHEQRKKDEDFDFFDEIANRRIEENPSIKFN